MTIVVEETPYGSEGPNLESSRSAISWGAIIGGAVAAISATLILLLLGTALGFASVSPWAGASASAAAVGVGAVIWLVITQWLSAAFGGYLTGRLRTKWAAAKSDEVFFRDTAHGFLSWAVSTAIVALVVMSAAGGGANMAASIASGAAAGAGAAASDPMAYVNDTLFRPAPEAGAEAAPAAEAEAAAAPAADATAAAPADAAPAAAPPAATPATSPTAGTVAAAATAPDDAEVRAQSSRILTRALTADMAAGDRTYLAQTIAARTGISQAEAEQRIDGAVASAKETAETARKAAIGAAFAGALSLLVGAFVAAVAGALGGRHRDEL